MVGKSYHGLPWSWRDTAAHQGLSDITGLKSKLIGMKFKNSLRSIKDCIFSPGWTKLCNFVGEAWNPNTFHRGVILRTITGKLWGVDSAGVLRKGVIKSRVIIITSKILKELKLRLLELNEIFMQTLWNRCKKLQLAANFMK